MGKLKIAIDIRSTLKQKTGIGFYTLNLVNSLAKLDKKNSYYLYSDVSFFNKKKKLIPLPGENFRHHINRFKLNTKFFLKGLDIIHTSSYNLTKPKDAKLVVVVHGVIHKGCPNIFSNKLIEEKENALKKIIPFVDKFIACSYNTKEDLLKFYPVDENKVEVIYPGVREDIAYTKFSLLEKENTLSKYKINKPYLLFVGMVEPRKNIEGLISAFNILKKKNNIFHKLVIAGGLLSYYTTPFSLVKKLDLENDVIFTNYLSEKELSILYNCCDVFVFPSFYEGVGLPVLEALSLEKPVVTSNNSSLKEIAKDCAVLVDPFSPSDIAEGVIKIIEDSKFRDFLIEKAKERIKLFSWQKTAQETLKIFFSLN